MDPAFTEAVRELVNELNAHSASGLITQRALVLTNRVEQMLHGIERAQRAEHAAGGER